MLNKTLQTELTAHFKKIKEREEQLEEIKKSLKLHDKTPIENLESEIKAELTKRIKGFLDKNNFNYEKDRNSKQARVIFEEGKLKTRDFKNHSFYEFNPISNSDLNEYLPKGLIEAKGIIFEKLKEIKEVILEFKEKINLKRGIKIQQIDSKEIETKNIKEIEVSFNCEKEHYSSGHFGYSYSSTHPHKYRDDKFEIKLNDRHYGVDEALYSDEIFNHILSLINKFKEHKKGIDKIKENKKEELRHFVFNQIDKMIILGELEE